VVGDGRLVTIPGQNVDRYLNGRELTPVQYDRHVRNIYNVLLTRALKGVVIYASDARTREFLRELVSA
jgi:DUF2075 family protein